MFAVFYATLGMPMAMWANRHNPPVVSLFHCGFTNGRLVGLCSASRNGNNLCDTKLCLDSKPNAPRDEISRRCDKSVYHQHYWYGLGPFTVGFFSDVFSQQHGVDSLRYGLVVAPVVSGSRSGSGSGDACTTIEQACS